MNTIDEQAVWRAFQEHVSPLDENFETLAQWVRDGIADGTLAPTGIPSLVEKFHRVMATHQAIAEKAGTMPVDAEGPDNSPWKNVKPIRASL